MIKLYLNGVELKNLEITQNGVGRCYGKNGNRNGPFWATTIDKFDNATPPAEYTALNDCSHAFCQIIDPAYTYPTKPASHLLQLAYDIRGDGGLPWIADRDVVVDRNGSTFTYVIYVEGGITYRFCFEHQFDFKAPGTVIKAGEVISRVKDMSGAHSHVYVLKNSTQYDLKNIALSTDTSKPNMEYTKNTKLRQGPGTSYPQTGMILPGTVLRVKDGPRSADGYTWYDLEDASKDTGWAIEGAWTDKPVTDFTPAPTPPSEDEAVTKVKSGNFEVVTRFENYKLVESRIN